MFDIIGRLLILVQVNPSSPVKEKYVDISSFRLEFCIIPAYNIYIYIYLKSINIEVCRMHA